jgi:hypothetical protein
MRSRGCIWRIITSILKSHLPAPVSWSPQPFCSTRLMPLMDLGVWGVWLMIALVTLPPAPVPPLSPIPHIPQTATNAPLPPYAALWPRPPNFLLVDYYNQGSFPGSVFEVAALHNNVTYSRPCCGIVPSGASTVRVSGGVLLLAGAVVVAFVRGVW